MSRRAEDGVDKRRAGSSGIKRLPIQFQGCLSSLPAITRSISQARNKWRYKMAAIRSAPTPRRSSVKWNFYTDPTRPTDWRCSPFLVYQLIYLFFKLPPLLVVLSFCSSVTAESFYLRVSFFFLLLCKPRCFSPSHHYNSCPFLIHFIRPLFWLSTYCQFLVVGIIVVSINNKLLSSSFVLPLVHLLLLY